MLTPRPSCHSQAAAKPTAQVLTQTSSCKNKMCMGCASAAIITSLVFHRFDNFFADEKVHNPVLMSCRRLCRMSYQRLLRRPGQETEGVTHIQPIGSYAFCIAYHVPIRTTCRLASVLRWCKVNQETHRCVGKSVEICQANKAANPQ